MKYNLTTTNQNAKLALNKSKNLLNITNKIFATKKPTSPTKIGRISDDQIRAIEFEDQLDAWIDKDTDLMWEVKNKENIDFKYVWNEEWIEEVYKPQRFTDSVKDTFSYAKKLNEMNYAGFNDWRVPTNEELETLITKKQNNNLYIKLPLSKNSSNFYWSSTAYENYKNSAWDDWYTWGVFFYEGDVSSETREYNGYIRCVRAGQ
jgi:hypothetical protein